VSDISKLTDGDRAKLGVIAGMIGGPSARNEFSAPVDDAIAAVARVGSPNSAPTRTEREERIRAIKSSGTPGTASPDAKAKPTREQTLARLEAKMARMSSDERYAYAVEREWSPEARQMVEEAYVNTAGAGLAEEDEDDFHFEERDEDDGDEFAPTDEDESYTDLLSEFRNEEAA
jgi:hypothetical protein